MSQKLKYISRIKDDFDVVICGVNGVFMRGEKIIPCSVETLIKLYQSGKKIALASNSGFRVRDLYYLLKRCDVPMNIFYAMITAGEIAHFYLKNNRSLGKTYFNLTGEKSSAMEGLNYTMTDSMVMADFILAETYGSGLDMQKVSYELEQALHLRIPMVCVGNNTSIVTDSGIMASVGTAAEKYAMMGGEIIPIGKPDVRIAAYLTEKTAGFDKKRCLVIGDCMSTDMRMANAFGAQTLFLTQGVHITTGNADKHVDDLSNNYGLNVDYYMEKLQW